MDKKENVVKVSVIIPIYNAERYLYQCLECIGHQTLKEIEVLCVNDGSIDASVEIIENYCKRDNRFRLLSSVHREGKGAGAARNLGLKHAKGKYILWLDADDWFDLDMIQTVYEQAEQASAEIVLFDAIRYDVNTGAESPYNSINFTVLPKEKEVFSGEDILSGLFQFSGAVWNKLFLKSYIEEKGLLCQEIYFTDDVFLAYIAMLHAKRMVALDKQFVHYRWKQAESQLTNRLRYIETMYVAPMAILEELKEAGKYPVCKDSFLRRWIPHMLEALRSREEYEEFEERYNLLKKIFLYDFELSEICNKNEPEQRAVWWMPECKNIILYSLEEYLFKKLKIGDRIIGDYFLPKELMQNRSLKVAIYGAGNYGKKLYVKLISAERLKKIDVVLWVDRCYEKIGYPVRNPEELTVTELDYIIISIVDTEIVDQVRDYIVGLGISRDKILCLLKDE